MDKPVCRLRTLAGNGLCAVEYCAGCHVFHLRIGITTLNLNPSAFAAVCGTAAAVCGTAAAALVRFQNETAQAVQAAHEPHPTGSEPRPKSLH